MSLTHTCTSADACDDSCPACEADPELAKACVEAVAKLYDGLDYSGHVKAAREAFFEGVAYGRRPPAQSLQPILPRSQWRALDAGGTIVTVKEITPSGAVVARLGLVARLFSESEFRRLHVHVSDATSQQSAAN